MGLDYSFFLTFPKDRLCEALDGVIAIAEPDLGSTMSLMFSESSAMRKAFIQLLESHDGVYGILNRELEADLFWWRGEALEVSVGSIYTPPEEIDAIVKRVKAGGCW